MRIDLHVSVARERRKWPGCQEVRSRGRSLMSGQLRVV